MGSRGSIGSIFFFLIFSEHFRLNTQSASDSYLRRLRVVSKMKFLLFFVILLIASSADVLSYEEILSEMLIQCNAYQTVLKNQANIKNRTAHDCEKEDPDGDFSYVIETMQTRYSKRKFLCAIFFKDDHTKLNLRLLFSHSQFQIDAVRLFEFFYDKKMFKI